MKKILIVGFACLSLVAVAQTKGTGAAASNKAKVSGPREAASGQASGKQAGRESSAPSVSEVVAKAPSGGKKQVATGDVNGDGRPYVAATAGSSSGNGQNAAINNSHSNIKNAREAASGQASGKRQYAPVRIKKEVDAASPKL